MTSSLFRICILLELLGSSLVLCWGQEWIGALPHSTHCLAQPYDPKDTNYDSWISDYKISFTLGNPDLDLNQEPIELAIWVIEGDDLESDNESVRCGGKTSMFIFARGTVSWQSIPAVHSGQPSPRPRQLPAQDLKLVRSLIESLRERLPDDYSKLPPRGRRLVLQVRTTNDGVEAGVYDRANLPDSILEILALTGAATGPMTMNFPPTVTRTQEEPGDKEEVGDKGIPVDAIGIRRTHPRNPVTHALGPDTVTLAISPNREFMVERDLPFDGRLVVSDTKWPSVVLEKPDYVVNRRWIYFSHAWFSPDGRFLLLLSNLPAIYIYDTATWQQLKSSPGLPADALVYYPSSDWKRGVAVSRDGETSLWDAVAGRKLDTLDLDCELNGVSFSPDDSLVAVTSARHFTNGQSDNRELSDHLSPIAQQTFRFRIWETKSGHFLREMRYPYYFAHNGMGDPIWWDQGKYILTETSELPFGGQVFGIWNVESGKFRGGLSGCAFPHDPSSFPFGFSGERLFCWCREKELATWDVATAIDEIAELESSLTPSPQR